MTIGQRIRTARLEVGLSQRDLAGEEMTRNMLSALEHDSAKPSVATLMYLSEKLCKPIGYFFGEDSLEAAAVDRMENARSAYFSGDFAQCLELLEEIDPVFMPEGELLRILSLMGLTEKALKEGRIPYARTLLQQCEQGFKKTPYSALVHRQWAVLKAQTGDYSTLDGLEGEDQVLLLRAEAALKNGDGPRAGQLLDAVESKTAQWYYLRGEVCFHRKEYEQAASYYHKAENWKPEIIWERLEICYREMDNYMMAYYYATKKR